MTWYDEHAERIAERLRSLLAANRAGVANRVYTPDLVERVGGFAARTFEEIIGAVAGPVLFVIFPGPRPIMEEATRRIKATMDMYVLGFRRYEEPTDQYSLGNVLADTVWADGAVALTGAPGDDAGYIRCLMQKGNTITAGTLTLVGLDQNGNALTLTFSPADDGFDVRLANLPSALLMASVSSATIAGTVGGSGGDPLRIGSRPDRWTIQERLIQDIAGPIREAMASQPPLVGWPDQIQNIQVVDEDLSFYTPGWTVVQVTVRVEYTQQVGCP